MTDQEYILELELKISLQAQRIESLEEKLLIFNGFGSKARR